MTTPANDETKKEEKTTSTSGSQPVKADAPVTPKKRKRKRKPRKTTPITTEEKQVSDTKETIKEVKTTPTKDKPTTPVHHTRKKTEDTTPEDKKEEHKATASHKKEVAKVETKRPNLDIKSDAHMLPGIDNIHEYIASKKAAAPHAHEKKEGTYSFVTPDGTDLLQLPGLYAIVPHSKGDHKLVYLQGNAPEGLGDDPRKRTPGKMYVKNGRDIYMVTLVMKEYPTLKDSHGESYDVWLIENEQQLTDQIAAIKQGIGGGENFGETMFLSDIDTKEATSGVETIVPDDTKQADTLPQQEEENQVVQEETQEESNEEEVVTEQEDISAKEVDTEASLPSETSEESNEETADEISGADTLNSIENTIDIDIPEEDIAMIDLTLPTDENITAPDTIEIDGESVNPEQAPETEIETEIGQNNEQVTLDMNLPEEIVADDTQESPEQKDEELPTNTQEKVQEEVQQEKEEITLDMNQEDEAIENEDKHDEAATGHFMSTESSLPTTTIDLSDSPEEPSRSLFGSTETPQTPTEPIPVAEEPTTGGMFRDPAQVNEDTAIVSEEEPTEIINRETTTPPLEETTTPSEPLFSSQSEQHTMPGITPSPDETIDIDTETETGNIVESDPSSVNLDDLSIESPEETSIDLDNLPVSSEPTEPVSSLQGTSTSSTTTPVKKSSFPFHIIIRVVLFLLISGALVLVRKVMFPTIQGTKPIDDTPSDTGQVIDDTLQPTDTDSIPTTDTDTPTPEDTNITPPVEDTPVVVDDTPPAPESLTLNELTEKLKVQQTDARKVLNIAKLLENKQAIKFSLAAMLKAGNVLERIDTETTITAQDVLQESQKIDRYLQEANKLIE